MRPVQCSACMHTLPPFQALWTASGTPHDASKVLEGARSEHDSPGFRHPAQKIRAGPALHVQGAPGHAHGHGTQQRIASMGMSSSSHGLMAQCAQAAMRRVAFHAAARHAKYVGVRPKECRPASKHTVTQTVMGQGMRVWSMAEYAPQSEQQRLSRASLLFAGERAGGGRPGKCCACWAGTCDGRSPRLLHTGKRRAKAGLERIRAPIV